MRSNRDVWSFRPGRFADAHTATFPPELPARCIMASTSEKGACKRCGASWKRVIVNDALNIREKQNTKYAAGRLRAGRFGVARDGIAAPETIGWEPTCACGVAETVPCIVLDPFAGSGTTLAVAKALGRDYVGIEINEREYGPLIERRLRETGVRPPEKIARSSTASRARRA
jgi:hypothetical protein